MKRILIADDHALMREGIRLILQHESDFQIAGEAENGKVAIDRTLELKPDAVIMDITMPLINGIEATEHILEQLPDVRILILSAQKAMDTVVRAFRAGAAGFIPKEATGDELITALRTILFRNTKYVNDRIASGVIRRFVIESDRTDYSPLENLSLREREVLQLSAEGHSSREISHLLNLSVKTVDTYRSRMMKKLAIHTNSQLVLFAARSGLISDQ